MNQEQCIEKIKKLLLMQRCNGTTKQEEITSFKKALELALIYDVKEIDLDSILRHIYKLENNADYNKSFGEAFDDTNFESEPEEKAFVDNSFEDNNFEFKPRRKDNLAKDITIGILLCGIITWLLRGLIKHIQGLLPFIIWIFIPFIFVVLFQNIKTIFGMV